MVKYWKVSRMCSEGFSFNSRGLEVGVMVSPSVVSTTATVRNRPQHIRSELARPHHWAALTKCDPDAVLQVDFLANRLTFLRFCTCMDFFSDLSGEGC